VSDAASSSILGVSGLYHDSAAALLVGSTLAAAAQEERFSGIKNDRELPQQAVTWCLEQAGIGPADLDYVAFYDKPLLKLDRLLETYLAFAPRGFTSFFKALPIVLQQKLFVRRRLDRMLQKAYGKRFVFTRHHEAHAASAFFPSPFEEAAILTIDGVGEWATATIGHGRGHRIEPLVEQRFPHSLGLLYSAFTQFCGFRVLQGEYKLMGLAPYGEPRYVETIKDHLVHIREDGSFWLDLRYFDYCVGHQMTNRRFAGLFEGAKREDLAASVQAVTEDIVMTMARHAKALTGARHLVMAGGVALNCVANGKVLREGPFDDLWVQPASGDAGGALGAALYVRHQLLGQARTVGSEDGMQASLLGPAVTETSAREALDARATEVTVEEHDDEGALVNAVATELAGEALVGWAQGRLEFGPRALGSRSILANPTRADMKDIINARIKHREPFRPFAPAVLRERAAEFFDVPDDLDAPYMTLVATVREDKRRVIPAVTHVDGTARLQTVDHRHGRYRALIEAFAQATGCPVVLNTSFNDAGQPIVADAETALDTFLKSELDLLVLDRFIVRKRGGEA